MKISEDYVKVATNICPVCGVEHSYNVQELLIHKRGKAIKNTVTGHSLCEEHDKLFNRGYIALIEGNQEYDGSMIFTGNVMHIRKEVAKQIFALPEEQYELPLMYIEPEAFNQIKAMI